MSNTNHAVQATPSIAWVLETKANMAAAQVTPYGAWLRLRQPLCAAVEISNKALSAAVAGGGVAEYNAAGKCRDTARAALKEFDGKNKAPNSKKLWKDVSQDDPLLRVIFGK